MPKALTLQQAQQIFINKGVNPLFTEYKNARQKLDFQCKCGNTHSITLAAAKYFDYNLKCKECSFKNKISLSNERGDKAIIAFFSHLKQEFICVSQRKKIIEGREVQKTKVRFKCSCGNTTEKNWSDLLRGQAVLCRECIVKFQYKKGKEHPRYNPSISDEERETRNRGNEFVIWTKQILIRDKFTCQLCGKRGTKLSVYHLFNWAHYPKERYNLSNGISICKEHHIEFHSKEFHSKEFYGKGNNTPEQFFEYAFKFKEAA